MKRVGRCTVRCHCRWHCRRQTVAHSTQCWNMRARVNMGCGGVLLRWEAVSGPRQLHNRIHTKGASKRASKRVAAARHRDTICTWRFGWCLGLVMRSIRSNSGNDGIVEQQQQKEQRWLEKGANNNVGNYLLILCTYIQKHAPQRCDGNMTMSHI